MKKLYLLGAIALMAATACTSSEEPLADIDVNYIEAASRGDVLVKYVPVDQTDSVKSLTEDGDWEVYDPFRYVGGLVYYPSFVIRNGKTCSEADLFTSAGPDLIYGCFNAYKKATGKSITAYIGSDVDYNESTGKIVIGTDIFDVVKLNQKEAYLIGYLTYADFHNNPVQLRRSEITYKAEPFVIDGDNANDIIGESIHDVRRQILARCRAHFGDKIDLTEVYGGQFYLDAGNIIDLDEIESQINSREQREKSGK